MTHDVCNRQRLYDEFMEEVQEAVLELLTELPAPKVTLGPPLTPEQKAQRVSRPIFVALPPQSAYIDIDVYVEL